MTEPNFMWGDIFPPKGQRDFTEKDMVKVAAMHLESQAEIVALRAANESYAVTITKAAVEMTALRERVAELEAAVREGHSALLTARDYHGFACTENLNSLRATLGKQP